jgi:hypothetical protein
MDISGLLNARVLPFVFVGMWLFMVAILMKFSGMKWQLEEQPAGKPYRSSRWGTVTVNGTMLKRCAKVDEFTEGYVIKAMWLFGGGKLWLPKAGLRIGGVAPGGWLSFRSRELRNGTDRVVLCGHLADFVNPRTVRVS